MRANGFLTGLSGSSPKEYFVRASENQNFEIEILVFASTWQQQERGVPLTKFGLTRDKTFYFYCIFGQISLG